MISIKKLPDIFNIINKESLNYNNILDVIETIIENLDELNWNELIFIFYEYNLEFNNETNTFFINYLNKIINKIVFTRINKLFETINNLNINYNKNNKNEKFTLYNLYTCYITIILDNINKKILLIWFDNLFNNSIKSKNHNNIIIFKNYVDNCDEQIKEKFINEYSLWLSNKLLNNNLSLKKKLLKLQNINKINDIYPYIISKNIIINFINLLEKYLEDYLNNYNNIESESESESEIQIIIDEFNKYDLIETNYNKIINLFCNNWIDINKNNFNKINDLNLYLIFKNINPLLKNNIFIKIYEINDNLMIYFIVTLDFLLKQIIYDNNIKDILTDDILSLLDLINHYNNKNKLFEKYFDILIKRIINILSKKKINLNQIENEKLILNILNKSNNNNNLKKINIFLNNIKNNIDHNRLIEKCNIFFKDKSDNILDFKYDLSKISYNVIDKYILDLNIGNYLIDFNKYPDCIKKYFLIGNEYFKKIYIHRKFEWNYEKSIINFKIGKYNIVSKIIQFIIIYIINNNKFTINDLILNIYNQNFKESGYYLNIYIQNLISNNIIKKIDNILFININSDINISDFNIKYSINNNLLNIDDNSNSILRKLLLTKMFKTNSTKEFHLDMILEDFKEFLNKIQVFIDNIDDKTINEDLLYLEKRDIIEKHDDNSYIYIYL